VYNDGRIGRDPIRPFGCLPGSVIRHWVPCLWEADSELFGCHAIALDSMRSQTGCVRRSDAMPTGLSPTCSMGWNTIIKSRPA
jgi:hypothetical protein